jgi:hypothetical protein
VERHDKGTKTMNPSFMAVLEGKLDRLGHFAISGWTIDNVNIFMLINLLYIDYI